MVHLDRINRQFGPRTLFRELSWLIPRGARLGLVGPNGAGKTTLMRILDGREQPDGGAVHRPSSVRVGYLPQEVETVERGSVLDVVLAGFEELASLEREIEAVSSRLEGLAPDDPDAARLTERYGQLRERFEQLDGDRVEARARSILSGLAVPAASFHEPLETLSGGWRMRVVLARLLLGAPDLLLLDEPTNHLDLDAIAWLEGFLENYEGAFVVVSHDRYFLNRMVRVVVELDRGKLTPFTGNYDDYVDAKQAREEALEKAARQQQREFKQAERFIERFRYKNTKARLVQSKIRALGKIERIETEKSAKRIHFGFPPAPRSGDIVVRAEGVSKRYGDLVVYDGMDLLLRRGDRVALIGPNGTGKSTLLKMLAGRLSTDSGRLELGHKVTVQYYAQHQLDDLDPVATVLEEMERVSAPGERLRMRKLLGAFLFSGDDVDKRVSVLSGGEKARLALARLLVRPSNLLLLDEPTNHLDLRSREMLEDALGEYEGSLVVVSHDRYFINRVITSVGEVGQGRIQLHPGDYDEWIEWQRRRAQEQLDVARDEQVAVDGADQQDVRYRRQEEKRRQAEERNRLYRERQEAERKLAPVEAEIARTEQRIRELEEAMTAPEVYSDPEEAARIGRDRSEAEARLESLYADWERLADPDPG